jgi:hypothetical protein
LWFKPQKHSHLYPRIYLLRSRTHNCYSDTVAYQSPRNIDTLKQAYDDPYHARAARRELEKLKQKNSTFIHYLAEFRRLM